MTPTYEIYIYLVAPIGQAELDEQPDVQMNILEVDIRPVETESTPKTILKSHA